MTKRFIYIASKRFQGKSKRSVERGFAEEFQQKQSFVTKEMRPLK